MSDFYRIAQDIARKVLGAEAQLREESGGLNNEVFTVDHEGGYVIRLNEKPSALRTFHKEHWAIKQAEAVGVPVPKIIEVGDHNGVPYMVSRRAEGDLATKHEKRVKVAGEMGRIAALINEIPTKGFGRTFDWAPNEEPRNNSWPDFLHKEFEIDHRIEVLLQQNLIDDADTITLRQHLLNLEISPKDTRLTHGDLRMKNVLVDEGGNIMAILDWEHALSSPPPYWELSIALHDRTIDEKTEFVRGYGLSEEELIAIAPALRALNILNYAPYVERAVKRGHADKLETYRIHLSGAMDLY